MFFWVWGLPGAICGEPCLHDVSPHISMKTQGFLASSITCRSSRGVAALRTKGARFRYKAKGFVRIWGIAAVFLFSLGKKGGWQFTSRIRGVQMWLFQLNGNIFKYFCSTSRLVLRGSRRYVIILHDFCALDPSQIGRWIMMRQISRIFSNHRACRVPNTGLL